MSEVSSIAIIFIITIELFFGLLIQSKYYYNVSFLLRVNTPLVFLIGPSIYFLVYSHIYPKSKWKRGSFVHLIPFIGAILYFLPVYFSSHTEKVQYLDALYIELTYDSILIGGLRRIHQASYLIASILLIKKAKSLKLKRKIAPSIINILVLFGVFLLIDIYRYFFSFDLFSGIIDTFLLSLVAIYLVYNQLKIPKSIKPIQRVNDKQLQKNANHIKQVIGAKKVYLNPKLSLEELAIICELQKHTVSQTINNQMKTNFNELINKYRVEESIRLLKQEETSILTIKAIAEMAGFNTVSSFNSNFKKITGKSPKEFRLKK
jgi:AraC-like DNA-binding protein